MFPATIVPYSRLPDGDRNGSGYANAVAFYKGLTGLQDRQGNQQIGLSRIDWNIEPAQPDLLHHEHPALVSLRTASRPRRRMATT